MNKMFTSNTYPNNLLAFHGPINLDLVSTLANYLKKIVKAEMSVQQKVFRIFIELTQNVSFYSASTFDMDDMRKIGKGWLTVDEDSNYYLIKTGNVIISEHVDILKQNCIEINKLNIDELRELKRKTRKKACIKDIGAHIGLIHTGILSGNEIDIVTKEIDNKYSFFTIQAKIDKHLKN